MTKRNTALRAKAPLTKTAAKKQVRFKTNEPKPFRPLLPGDRKPRLDVSVKALPFPSENVQVTLTLPATLWQKSQPLLADKGLTLSDFLRASLRTLPERKMLYGLSMALQFGKYKGETLETVIRLDPTYIQWMVKSVGRFEMDEECLDLLDQMLQAE